MDEIAKARKSGHKVIGESVVYGLILDDHWFWDPDRDGAVDNDNNNKDVFTAVDQAEITKDVCLMYDFVNQHLQEATRVSDLSLEEDDVLKLVSEKSENRVVRNIKASMKCSDREVSKPATESFSFRIPPSENIESQGRSDLPGIDVLVSAAKRKSRLWSQPTVRLMLR
ncbi:unnamed protein product [Microthlaspi erraticum]|uniref:Uncharacterized protein n=1 Tax=Microthlaspi erraticum TaxID=1685480 RepID=A0A6D2IDZ8_9BRAS|nr:unnamed protein product [Microthlaspi erraticum]